MGIDVMIVGEAEAIASRPGNEMLAWLEDLFEDFDIRYGSICLFEDEIYSLRRRFSDDPVGAMLLDRVNTEKARGAEPPYIIELMISA